MNKDPQDVIVDFLSTSGISVREGMAAMTAIVASALVDLGFTPDMYKEFLKNSERLFEDIYNDKYQKQKLLQEEMEKEISSFLTKEDLNNSLTKEDASQ